MSKDKNYSVFNPQYYPETPTPPSKNIITELDEQGNNSVINIKPKRTGAWSFEYYFSPLFKAQLAKLITFLIIIFPISLLSSITLYNKTPAIIITFIVAIMIIHTLLLHQGVGIGKIPAPQPIILSWIVSKIPVKGYTESPIETSRRILQGENYNGPEERELRKSRRNTIYEKDILDNSSLSDNQKEDSIEVVNNYNNGNPSPATILTNWMNNDSVKWTEEDLHDNAGGLFSRFDISLLLEDNESIWKDPEKIEILSEITGTSPSQWEEAYEKWISS